MGAERSGLLLHVIAATRPAFHLFYIYKEGAASHAGIRQCTNARRLIPHMH